MLLTIGVERTESSRRAKDAKSSIVRGVAGLRDRKSTRLNSSHLVISYAVFCLKKKNTKNLASDSVLQVQSETANRQAKKLDHPNSSTLPTPTDSASTSRVASLSVSLAGALVL